MEENVCGDSRGEGMSDIKQAGKWLEEGKHVRRSTWLHNARIGRHIAPLCHSLLELLWDEGPVVHRGEFILSVSDLTTEDWEIAK
jgi:hypothetical protein